MVVIRLARSGAKKKPFYHLVVADKRMPRDGRYIEKVGYYNPVSQGKAERLEIHRELIQSWIDKGAQPSPRVSFLIRAHDLGTMKITADNTVKKAPAKKAKAEDKPAAEAKVEAKKEEKPKAEAKTEDKAEAKPAAKADKAEAKTEAKPKAEAKKEEKPKAETKAEAKPKAEAKTEAKPKAEAKTEAKPKDEAKKD